MTTSLFSTLPSLGVLSAARLINTAGPYWGGQRVASTYKSQVALVGKFVRALERGAFTGAPREQVERALERAIDGLWALPARGDIVWPHRSCGGWTATHLEGDLFLLKTQDDPEKVPSHIKMPHGGGWVSFVVGHFHLANRVWSPDGMPWEGQIRPVRDARWTGLCGITERFSWVVVRSARMGRIMRAALRIRAFNIRKAQAQYAANKQEAVRRLLTGEGVDVWNGQEGGGIVLSRDPYEVVSLPGVVKTLIRDHEIGERDFSVPLVRVRNKWYADLPEGVKRISLPGREKGGRIGLRRSSRGNPVREALSSY